MRCAAITRAGGRCKSVATEGTYCWNHAPEKGEARKQRASRGGKTGGTGRPSGLSETGEAKRWIRALVAQLLKGEVERDVATACFMGLGTLARFIELERRIREQAREGRQRAEEKDQERFTKAFVVAGGTRADAHDAYRAKRNEEATLAARTADETARRAQHGVTLGKV